MKRKLPLLGLVSLAAMVAPAHAAFHLMSVTEVFAGSVLAPNAQYVELTMYSAGQNVVGGHAVQVYGADDTLIQSFLFAGNVAGGGNQAKILIATSEAQALFNLTPDLIMAPVIPASGGKVCFDAIDCVAWGTYAGSLAGVGDPEAPSIGIAPGKAIHRRLDVAGSAALLEGADDTGDSANDFVTGVPSPVNNAGVAGAVPASTCGNTTTEGLESCDDGNANNVDACKNDCTAATCGDGLTSAGEQCDDANLVDTDLCKNDCTTPICGDGVTSDGEQCDDDNDINDDACKNDCTLPVCGDNVVSPGEQCDDGNQIPGDGCEPGCVLITCGDGTFDPTTEECDDGNAVSGDGCAANCVIEICGDGAVNNNGTEACDDGNADETDGCLSGCVLASCGDSSVNQPSEACDDGNTVDGDGCDTDCTIPSSAALCGDGTVDATETCDDGNTASGDGCEADCTLPVAPIDGSDDGTAAGGDDGCGCRVAGERAEGAPERASWLLLAAIALLWRRRRPGSPTRSG